MWQLLRAMEQKVEGPGAGARQSKLQEAGVVDKKDDHIGTEAIPAASARVRQR